MSDQVMDTKAEELTMKTGITRENREKLSHHLSKALSDTYVLLVKTQGVHWNVAGPLFYSLHKMFEEQYEDLFEAADDIAERIRSIGFGAPGTFAQFAEIASVKENRNLGTTENMVRQLAEDNEICARTMREAALEAEKVEDIKTHDLLTDRVGEHEENAWMLRALLA